MRFAKGIRTLSGEWRKSLVGQSKALQIAVEQGN
jgi:hypothetical protein